MTLVAGMPNSTEVQIALFPDIGALGDQPLLRIATGVSLEAAVAGPELFRSWLIEAERAGWGAVGFSNTPMLCPLARFVGDVVGLPHVAIGLPLWGGAWLLAPHVNMELPEWCTRFASQLDSDARASNRTQRPVSPALALETLAAVCHLKR